MFYKSFWSENKKYLLLWCYETKNVWFGLVAPTLVQWISRTGMSESSLCLLTWEVCMKRHRGTQWKISVVGWIWNNWKTCVSATGGDKNRGDDFPFWRIYQAWALLRTNGSRDCFFEGLGNLVWQEYRNISIKIPNPYNSFAGAVQWK